MERYEKFMLEAKNGLTFEFLENTGKTLVCVKENWQSFEVPEGTSKNVLKAKNKKSFEVLEGRDGEIIIVALKISDTRNSQEYVNPPIPEGYKHICGEWNNGFVIQRDTDKSEFVWIPVGSLEGNGTLGGEYFKDKFGRRYYENYGYLYEDPFVEFDEALLQKQYESVKKYGGFYISRYNISKSSAGEPQSIKGVMPWVNINFDDAKKIASTIENNFAVKSHLTFGAEYDSVLEWFIKTEAKTLDEVTKDSTKWGNYWNTENSPKKLVETGSMEEWCVNNIYDFAGNVDEWTQEHPEGSDGFFLRGGRYHNGGHNCPVARRYRYDRSFTSKNTGFRAALYISTVHC